MVSLPSKINYLPSNLNYTILGLEKSEVFAFVIHYESTLAEDVLERACSKQDSKEKPSRRGEFWLLKQPIPFAQVNSAPWLLDSSTNLSGYATRNFLAEKVVDFWTNRDPKSLHVVIRLKY